MKRLPPMFLLLALIGCGSGDQPSQNLDKALKKLDTASQKLADSAKGRGNKVVQEVKQAIRTIKLDSIKTNQ